MTGKAYLLVQVFACGINGFNSGHFNGCCLAAGAAVVRWCVAAGAESAVGGRLQQVLLSRVSHRLQDLSLGGFPANEPGPSC